MNIEFEDIVRFVRCKNSLLNSVVNMEILKAQSYGIRIVCSLNVPEELPIKDIDLSRILVNLIDNSVEALRRVDTGDKIVELNITYKNGYLYITIQNRFDRKDRSEDEVLGLNTIKDDYKNHGYGHKIIRKIVDKYYGEVNYSVEDDEFIVEIMLDLKTFEEKKDG